MKRAAADAEKVSMSDSIKCWDCGQGISKSYIFCEHCNSVQSSAAVTHFERLGIAKNFEIGEKNLEVAYFALQRKLHPDMFVKKSDKEKKFSMQQTMDINAAYETLKSPLKRAEYILSLEGIIVNQDNGTSVKPSQELLMKSLEAREELAHIDSVDDIRKLAIKTADERIACIDEIKQQLAGSEFDKAAQNTIKLRYLEKMIEEIKNKK